jgi:protease IV
MALPEASPATPQTIIVQQPPSAFGRWGKWLLAALVIAVMFCIGTYGKYSSYYNPPDAPQEKYHSLAKMATKKIAIVEVSGTIMEGEDSFAMKQIKRVKEDKDVVGIVLRVNSPGGTVTGSDYIYHHLRDLVDERKLPLVVSMGSICASGGYYVSMAVGSQPDAIFAEPTTWTGSIGVIIPHFDVSGGLTKLGISEDSIESAPLKAMGSPTHKMTEEERKILQALVDDCFSEFKKIVVGGRPKFKDDQAALAAATTGQIFTANQALAHGLVDKIGFIEAAISRATELAGENAESVRCVKYEKQPTILGELMGAKSNLSGAQSNYGLSGLLDLATPRAFYLWSWLPAALSNSR